MTKTEEIIKLNRKIIELEDEIQDLQIENTKLRTKNSDLEIDNQMLKADIKRLKEKKIMKERRLTMDEMKKIHICKSCKRPEYWGKFRWLSGSMICRNCYRAIWESENKKIYKWDDLDGKRPTMEEFKKQEEEE